MKFKPGARLNAKQITDMRPEQKRQRDKDAKRTAETFRRFGYTETVSGDAVVWSK